MCLCLLCIIRTGRRGFEDVYLLEVVGESVDDVAIFVAELDLGKHGDTLLLHRHSRRLHTYAHGHTCRRTRIGTTTAEMLEWTSRGVDVNNSPFLFLLRPFPVIAAPMFHPLPSYSSFLLPISFSRKSGPFSAEKKNGSPISPKLEGTRPTSLVGWLQRLCVHSEHVNVAQANSTRNVFANLQLN